jgi:PAS domain S-box-containing protein
LKTRPARGLPHETTPWSGDQLDVLDASPNAIVAVDEGGKIRYANAETERAFGHTAAQLLGKRIEVLLPERLRNLHARHRMDFAGHRVGRPLGIGLDLVGRRRDGHEFPVEISLTPLETPDGPVVFATIIDITPRKAAEAALADSELRFRTVLEASPNAVVAIDTSGRVAYANPQVEQTFGYTRDEIVGFPVEMLLPERIADRHVAHREGFLAHPVARPMGIGLDLWARRKDGSEFPVEISLSPVDAAEGPRVFATIVDISARKAAESQLLQAQKLESIGRLAGGIAHDFNNMLFAINGNAEMLGQDLAAASGRAFDIGGALESLDAIRHAADRAAALTSQLLDFSRQRVVNPRVVDVNAAVQAIAPMLQRLIGEQIGLVLDLRATSGRIRADPSQLDQILLNLVINARDAMPGGGVVRVQSTDTDFDERDGALHAIPSAGRYVLLTVSDTGVGMDAETRDRIFEPFFTTKGQGKGTGLGLATIYGIVRQAGGHIWLYSEPGQGSVFRLFFPAVSEAVTLEDRPQATTETTGTGTILLVEDDPSVREMTTKVLARAGYDVIAVPDATHAMEMIEKLADPPDVLVTDVVMPGMSGIALAEEIFSRYPALGVVLLSGYTAETLDLTRAMDRGAAFVEKPVTVSELLAAIRRVQPKPAPRRGRA